MHLIRLFCSTNSSHLLYHIVPGISTFPVIVALNFKQVLQYYVTIITYVHVATYIKMVNVIIL